MAGYDPFKPIGPKKLAKQARRTVAAQTNPVISSINRQYATRAEQGSHQISDYTNSLAQALSSQAGQTHQIYAGAESNLAGVNEALANRLANMGAQEQSGLAQMLSGIGPAPAAGQNFSGAAAAGQAIGSAELSGLITRGANAENYSSMLPGFARERGAQDIRNLGAQLEAGRQKEVGSITEKIPGMQADELKQLQNLEMQKAVARSSSGLDQAKFNLQVAKARNQAQQGKIRLMQGAKRLQLELRGQNLSHEDRAAAQTALNINREARLGLSRQQLDISRQREARMKKSASKGGYTPHQISDYKKNSVDTLRGLKYGVPNKYYNPSSDKYHNGVADKEKYSRKPGDDAIARTRADKIRYLSNHGVPLSIAVWAVNQVYGKK